MSQISKEKTTTLRPWVCTKDSEFLEKDWEYQGRVSYGMSYIWNNATPYFHVTANLESRKNKNRVWRKDCCGMLHDIISSRKPSLKGLIPFHGWSQLGLPMYYIENTMYHYLHYRGWYELWGNTVESTKEEKSKSFTYFRKMVLLEDEDDISFVKSKDDLTRLTEWLENRKPLLQSRFHKTMKQFDIEYITNIEIEEFNIKCEKENSRRTR